MASKMLSIYVGNDAIRIAEMVKNNNKTVSLCNAAEISTPDNSVNDGYLVDITAISEAIRQAIFGRGFTAKDVVFTVSSKKIANKDVEVPYIKSPRKLQSILHANSGEYFPMSNANDYSYAYSILEEFTNMDGEHKLRVNAVAAPCDLIKCYYELADELKYNVKSVDYFGNSIIQLLSLQMDPGHTEMVLQVEKDATYVNVMRGNTVVLQRNVAYGKNAVVNSLMDVKKISEKDAKTLLSNETLLDQHVTADEYAATVQYLVQGIGKVAEFYRTKNKSADLEGIKIFGEGSSIAGIEKILERELGAEVRHFDTLRGVAVKGQASLTAEEVLRYLPNMGAVIDPMNLSVAAAESSRRTVSSEQTFKFMVFVLIVATVFMGAWFCKTFFEYKNACDERAELQAKIDAIADIEEIANAYDEAMAEYTIVNDFEISTHSDNELLIQFMDDLEKKMPTESYISGLVANDGDISFEVTSGWHLTTKNEIADVLVEIGGLEYVSNFQIASFSEDYQQCYVIDIEEVENEETGEIEEEYVFLREDPTEEDPEGALIPFSYDNEEYNELYPVIMTFVQTKYSVSLHIAEPVPEVEEGEAEESAEEVTEEGGAE